MKKLIIIALIGFLTSCSQHEVSTEHVHDEHNKEIVLSKEQLSVNNYKLGKPTLHPFHETIKATGVVDLPPSHRHVVSNYLSGYIKKINVIVGDEVKKGQVLAVIEHQEIIEMQERFLKAESQKEYLEQDYERLKELYEENVVSKKDFLSAKSKFLSIKAEVNSLRRQLMLINLSPERIKSGNMSSQYSVLAPADGIISIVNATTGEWVGNEKHLMTLVNPKHIHLEMKVFAKDIQRISPDQELTFSLHGSDDRQYNAHIYRIGAEVQEDQRVLVHAHPDSTLKNLIIGAYVQGEIYINSDSLLAIPSSSVTKLDEQPFVLLVKDRKNNEVHFERVPIRILHQYNNWIAIDSKWSDKEFLLNGVFDLIQEEKSGIGGHSH